MAAAIHRISGMYVHVTVTAAKTLTFNNGDVMLVPSGYSCLKIPQGVQYIDYDDANVTSIYSSNIATISAD